MFRFVIFRVLEYEINLISVYLDSPLNEVYILQL